MISAGIDAEVFSGGEDFFTALPTLRLDCVVLDLHMPGMSGFEVQSRLAQLEVKLPVVILTGHDTPDSEARTMAAGASAYLRKPVNDKLLLKAIALAIDSKP
jgi:two-component system, LuxR family, response regulator FixJ